MTESTITFDSNQPLNVQNIVDRYDSIDKNSFYTLIHFKKVMRGLQQINIAVMAWFNQRYSIDINSTKHHLNVYSMIKNLQRGKIVKIPDASGDTHYALCDEKWNIHVITFSEIVHAKQRRRQAHRKN